MLMDTMIYLRNTLVTVHIIIMFKEVVSLQKYHHWVVLICQLL